MIRRLDGYVAAIHDATQSTSSKSGRRRYSIICCTDPPCVAGQPERSAAEPQRSVASHRAMVTITSARRAAVWSAAGLLLRPALVLERGLGDRPSDFGTVAEHHHWHPLG